MPLFGKSHHDKTAPARRHDQATNTAGATGFAPSHTTTGTGPGPAAAGYMAAPGTGAGAGPLASGVNQTPYNHNNSNIQRRDGGVGAGQSVNDPYSSVTGAGTGVGYGAADIPPASTLGHGNERHRDGSGKRFSGKVEHAVGSMLGSNALKAKGLQKQHEADSINLQSQELAEAERLEAEAFKRRERAVAHGAHPDNQILGGGTVVMAF
ncbi:hypothetical protein CCMSSC00406_0000046 [Pleurotus cornucopiae]|uniref:Uncharacterized protein n=1 Tax=Pleurotus cornucopiae TaxID=5321 RepID=A0ACB7IYL7_PLECO|nr:hypothetical protein CCMSSC00406_0000046 [Pleurotus cornucopiae]